MLLFYQHIHLMPEPHIRIYPVEMHGTLLKKVVPVLFSNFYEVYENGIYVCQLTTL